MKEKILSKFLRLAEKGSIVLGLTIFPGILYALPQVGLLPKNFITFIKYGFWATLIILICIFWKSTLITAARNILLVLLVALALLSSFWSESPNFSLEVAQEILMMSLFGLYFATRFSLKEQVQLIALALSIGAIISTIFALEFPTVGLEQELFVGAWKGVYGQKNALGNMMVLSSLTFFTLSKENSRLYRWFGFIFSIVLMLLSTSKSSLTISFLLISIVIFYKNFRWQRKVSVIFANIGLLILGCISLLVSTYWIELLNSLGKDVTLTGRVPLWSYVLAKVMERPLFGYGLSAFWAPNSHYAIEAGKRVTGGGWIPPNAHNGLLDLTLDLGLIGGLLFLMTYFTTFIRALKRAYGTKNPEDLWPLSYLTFLAMNNVTESLLLGKYGLTWILYIAVVVTMNQQKQIPQINNLQNKNYLHVT